MENALFQLLAFTLGSFSRTAHLQYPLRLWLERINVPSFTQAAAGKCVCVCAGTGALMPGKPF